MLTIFPIYSTSPETVILLAECTTQFTVSYAYSTILFILFHNLTLLRNTPRNSYATHIFANLLCIGEGISSSDRNDSIVWYHIESQAICSIFFAYTESYVPLAFNSISQNVRAHPHVFGLSLHLVIHVLLLGQ